MSRLLARTVLVLAAAAAGASCVDVLGGREAPDTRYYSLDPGLPERPDAEAQPVTIRVERVAADPTARRLEILVRKREPGQEVVPFLYHRWIAMPDVFVGEKLREYLAATGLFARVVSEGDRAPADFRLFARLTRLEGVETDAGVEGLVVLEVVLAEAGGEGLEIIRHRIEKRAPAEDATPPAIADALSAALRALLEDVARRVDFGIREVRS